VRPPLGFDFRELCGGILSLLGMVFAELDPFVAPRPIDFGVGLGARLQDV
jgi:hypothetical protein